LAIRSFDQSLARQSTDKENDSDTMTAITGRCTARIVAIFCAVVAALALPATNAFVGTPTASNKNNNLDGYSPSVHRGLNGRSRFINGRDRESVGRSAQNDLGNDPDGPRDEGSGGIESRGPLDNLMKDTRDLAVGDWVVAKRDVPSLGIRAGAGYKLLEIFLKGASTKTQEGVGVEVVPLERYGDDEDDGYGSSFTKYLRVYNPRDHPEQDRGVLVTPEEIGLVSVRADWTEAAFLAVPGFFWVFVALAFSNYYTDRYGGSFLDAFFRT
jgi:hypothetical protein